MAWADGKDALADKLETISITTPIDVTTTIVYRNIPATVSDRYAWVLFAPRIRVERLPGGWREDTFRYRARLLVNDQDHDRAALIVENLVIATLDAFDDQSDLRTGGVNLINGPDVDEPGIIKNEYGAILWHSADLFFDIRLGEAKTFG